MALEFADKEEKFFRQRIKSIEPYGDKQHDKSKEWVG